jgi:hypothetical protein
MKNRLAALACQRRKIAEKIETQRIELTEISRRFHKPVAIIYIGLNAAHFMYRHPTLLTGTLAAAFAVWRKGIPGLNRLLPSPLFFVLSGVFSIFRARHNKNTPD